MYSVAIIGDIHDWHSQQLKSNLEKEGCKVFKFKFDQLKANFSKKKYFLNHKLTKFNGVWLRFINNGSLEEITTKLTFLHLIEEIGIYIHNSPKVIETTVDKVRTSGLLKINKIRSPNTFVKIGKISEVKKKNYLLKPIFGSQGKNILFINSKSKLKKIKPVGNVSYLQEFLGNPNDKEHWDIRVLVSNHKPISAMKRTSKTILTNACKGAYVEKLSITKELKNICIEVSKLFKLGYGGIDIKLFNKNYYVLEVNSVPSWRAIQTTCKKDITKILVNDFIKKIKMNKCSLKF